MIKFEKLKNINSLDEVYTHADSSAVLLISNDGKPDIVVINSDTFDELVTAIEVNNGFKEIDNGLYLTHEQVKRSFESKHGKLG